MKGVIEGIKTPQNLKENKFCETIYKIIFLFITDLLELKPRDIVYWKVLQD